MTTKTSTQLESALRYAELGWPVFPLHTPIATGDEPACSCRQASKCADIGKHPRYNKHNLTNGLKNATTDPDTIRGWWKIWPDANIGIRTGVDAGVIVLDVDGDKGQRSITDKPMPPTLTDRTGNGEHKFFAHPGGTVGNFAKKLPGLDLRGDGGYVVAPPSLHESGRRYEWLIPPWDEQPAPCPDWLLELLSESSQTNSKPASDVGETLRQGKRNDTLTSLAGTMRRRGMSESEIYAALKAVNEERCEPPLADDEVAKIAKSVSGYDPADSAFEKNGRQTVEDVLSMLEEIADSDTPDIEKKAAVLALSTEIGALGRVDRLLVEDALQDLFDWTKTDAQRFARAAAKDFRQEHAAEKKKREYASDEERLADEIGLPRLLAERILERYHFAQDPGGKLYTYQHGTYTIYGERLIKRQVKRLLKVWDMTDEWSKHKSEEVIEWIRVDAPELWARPPLDVLNVKNGLLDLKTGELKDHDPEYLSPVQLPVEYDPDADCPAWHDLIAAVFPDDCPDLAWELIAWLMMPYTSIQKSVLLLGEGRNGKSTFLNAVKNFLGRANVAGVSLHKLEANAFATARLVGRLANICPDLPSEHLAGTSVFKALTGGDLIHGEHKYHDSFEFESFARLVFSANTPPQSDDSSNAFFRRWLVVPFERTFTDEDEIPRQKLDAMLADPKELSGVLNMALAHLPRVLDQGITEAESMRKAWYEFKEVTDPQQVWLDLNTVEGPEMFVEKGELLKAYNADAKANGRPTLTASLFGKVVKRWKPSIQDGQKRIAGERPLVWYGIGLKADNW